MAYKLENNPLFNTQEEKKPELTPAHQEEKRRRGRPQKEELVRGNSVQEGLTEEYTRATFIMRVDLVEKLKNYAYTERLSMKEAVNKIIGEALEQEEKRLAKQGKTILDRNGGK